MSEGTELFSVPAGTRIEKTTDGQLVFIEPGKRPYTVGVVLGYPHPTVIKTEVADDCEIPPIMIGTKP